MKRIFSCLVLSCGLLVMGCQEERVQQINKAPIVINEEPAPELKFNSPESYSEGEPTISQVQKVAISCSELEPNKIEQWRRQAAVRAWLPKLSVGVNNDSVDSWHWETGSTTKCNDDVLRQGKSTMEWDVTLSWDLGDLIWSDAQTSIDVRSNLSVSLRRSILEDVTKLYFERLRIKMELDNMPIEDRGRRLEKELKLKELTASIDAFTGGYFSSQIHGS